MQTRIFQLTAGWLLLCATATAATYYGSSELYGRLGLRQYFPNQLSTNVVPAQADPDQIANVLPAPQDQGGGTEADQPVMAPVPSNADGPITEGRKADGFDPAPRDRAKPRGDSAPAAIAEERPTIDRRQEARDEKPYNNSSSNASKTGAAADPRYYEVTANLETLEGRYQEVQASLGAAERRLAQRGMGGLHPELKVKMAQVRGGLAGARQALAAGQLDQVTRILSRVKSDLEDLENYGRN